MMNGIIVIEDLNNNLIMLDNESAFFSQLLDQ
jgi:hypothetical protein